MTRRLLYVVVEAGRCAHCHKDAGDHAIDGLCSPQTAPHLRRVDVPESCYRGKDTYAFIDLNSGEARVVARRVTVA